MKRLAIWQTGSRAGDSDGNIARLAGAAAEAGRLSADLLVTPELWLSGYNWPDLIPACAEPQGGPSAQKIAEIARRNRIAIAYGYPERDTQTAALFNAVQLIDARGALASHYRKLHLFGRLERDLFKPGDHFAPPVLIGTNRVGLLICYDVEFPEAVRTLALDGAQLIVVPTAVALSGQTVPRTLVPARAIENHIHIAYVNHSGCESDLTYCGMSCVCGPEGMIVSALSTEALLVVEIDESAAQRAAAKVPYFMDRRPEIYRG